MAKIKKLKENGATIYPATIPEGVVDTNGFTLAELLDELLEVLAGGSRGNMELAFSDLRAAIGSEDGNDLSRFVAKVNAFLEDADASDATINRWKEIESFLTGITDTETLTGLLAENLQSAKSYADTKVQQGTANAVTMSANAGAADRVLTSAGSNKTAKDSGVAIGDLARNTTATSSANGLMSKEDKTKLDGIAAGANKYTLPVATASALGGVKSGEDVEVDSSGIITVHFAEKASEADCDENGDKIVDTYARFDELPVVATASKAGLVKSGGNITVTSDGTVTVNKAAAADMAGHATEADRASYATSAGSATSATKATQDKNGADIAATYLKSAAVTDVTEYAEITI